MGKTTLVDAWLSEVDVPVLCAGGFQTASVISRAIADGAVDGVTFGRPLIANPDLPLIFAQGHDRAPKPCTYCNKCLINFVENPLGCYELLRYDGDYDAMIKEVMSVFHPRPFR